MGRCPPDPGLSARPLRLWPAALLLAITACSPSVPPITTATQLASRLSDALTRQDPYGFASGFADSAIGRAQAERWYTLLGSAQAQLSATGPDALQVVTTLPGDRRPASEQLTLNWPTDGSGFTVVAEPRTPLWALEPATTTTTDAGTIVAAEDGAWASLMARAVAAVQDTGVVPAGTWSGRLVLEVPGSADDFALLTGSTADTSSAVTSCRTGTPRIVLSPNLSSFDPNVQFATLTHEAVHAATDSPCRKGESWAVEGLAESVAAQADPATAEANRSLVRRYLATHPVPSALPEHPSTPTDYALVQLAADQIRDRLGEQAPEYFARATDGRLTADDTAQATAWYRAALRSLTR